LTDTIEARVREVLEEKLSAIFDELGVDKYADVLDGEQAEINFTDAYMRTIRDPRSSTIATAEVEEDFKRQVSNTLKIKDLISDEKDLGMLVGVDSGFDLDAALRSMLVYYECSNGNPIPAIDNYSINDPIITRHLNRETDIESNNIVPSLSIKDFPNEAGYFMLWELSVSNDEHSRRFIPVFVNNDFLLRPMAGRKIWDVILDDSYILSVTGDIEISNECFEAITDISRNHAYDTFITLKEETIKRREETYKKYMYALKLRIEAAERIGIENIREHKLTRLAEEKVITEREYIAGSSIFPEFKPVLFLRMESGNA